MQINTIVTGASSGIGKALAVKLAQVGCGVLAIARSEKKLIELKRQNSNIQIVAADVSTNYGRKLVCDKIFENVMIKYLVHCAIDGGPIKNMIEISIDGCRI